MAPTDAPGATATGQPQAVTEGALGDGGKAALDAERRARREAEKQLKELAAKLDTYEQAGKTELEKAIARAEAAEKQRDTYSAELNSRNRKDTLTTAARDAHAVNPSLVADIIAARVTWNEDGTADGITDAIKQLSETDSYLFTAAPGARDATASTPPSLNDPDALTAALLGAVGVS